MAVGLFAINGCFQATIYNLFSAALKAPSTEIVLILLHCTMQLCRPPLQITTSCQFSACNFPSYSTLSWGAGPIVPFKFKRHHYSPFKLLTHGQAAAIKRRATASFKQGSLQLEQQTAPVNLFITCSNFSATSKSPLQKN